MMNPDLIMIVGLFALSLISGMVGLGVAFAAIPFLALFMADLVHEVQPLSLLLNGITALFAAAGFARSKLVNWSQAWPLAIICTIAALFGSWAAQIIPQMIIWYIYFAAVHLTPSQIKRDGVPFFLPIFAQRGVQNRAFGGQVRPVLRFLEGSL